MARTFFAVTISLLLGASAGIYVTRVKPYAFATLESKVVTASKNLPASHDILTPEDLLAKRLSIIHMTAGTRYFGFLTSFNRFSERGGMNRPSGFQNYDFLDLTNPNNNKKHGFGCDMVTANDKSIINSNCLQIFAQTPPDNGGDASGIYVRQTGGGNAISAFNLSKEAPKADIYASVSGKIMTVEALTGRLYMGQRVSGSGIVGNPTIVSAASGVGGDIGIYALSVAQPSLPIQKFTASFPSYPSSGFAIEAQSDGSKNTIFASNFGGSALQTVIRGPLGSGLSVLPGQDNPLMDARRALHVATADNSREYAYIDLAGDIFAAGSLAVNQSVRFGSGLDVFGDAVFRRSIDAENGAEIEGVLDVKGEYVNNGVHGITIVKKIGPCTVTISGGLVTGISGC